jgi:hypothetical protein
MSTRTPGLQSRSQSHSYWGQYAWAAGGSDPGAANLPNDTAAGGTFIDPYYSQLEVGDTASTFDASTANCGLWVCVSKGTSGGNDAQWRRCDNAIQAGTAAVDFGALPGSDGASVAVTGQSAIVAGSRVQAWIRLVSSVDHTPDEHRVENLKVTAGLIVPGTGFTIYVDCVEGLTHGNFNVDWEWI